jgi:hypothetical protein
LARALEKLEATGSDEIGATRGRLLFDRGDIERCLEFESTLKKRFLKELKLLDPQFEISDPSSLVPGGSKGAP